MEGFGIVLLGEYSSTPLQIEELTVNRRLLLRVPSIRSQVRRPQPRRYNHHLPCLASRTFQWSTHRADLWALAQRNRQRGECSLRLLPGRLELTSLLLQRYGYRRTMIVALALMAATVTIPFVAPNIVVLLIGELAMGCKLIRCVPVQS